MALITEIERCRPSAESISAEDDDLLLVGAVDLGSGMEHSSSGRGGDAADDGGGSKAGDGAGECG